VDHAALRTETHALVLEALPEELRDLPDLAPLELTEPLRGWSRILHAAGLAAPHWPVVHGGRGLAVDGACVVFEELAAAGAPRHVCFTACAGFAPALPHGQDSVNGTLEAIASGAQIVCVANTVEIGHAFDGNALVLDGETRPLAGAHIADRLLIASEGGWTSVDVRAGGVEVEHVRGPAGIVDRAILRFAGVTAEPLAALQPTSTGPTLERAWSRGRARALARRLEALIAERGATGRERARIDEIVGSADTPDRALLAALALDQLGAEGLLLPPNAPFGGAWAVEALLAGSA
jgi:hypothetical protein